uniref:Uncharacterized protein n=1 Tax=Clytia hemisphaerica TaxID=252671 RepID=A0A7M5X7K1_9CNID
MTHLFVDVNKYLDVEGQSSVERTVVRSGVPITYVYLAFFERETTFNALNEFFNLCTVPQLDTQLRQGRSLKENLSFIVDNGHGEDPDSPLTKMCLVRILISLKIQRITQRSFAEYNSKRNFVERVHASENMVLAQHGPFASKQVHANARIGSPEHEEKMEKMAENVVECLKTATFSENQLIAIPGPKTKVFNDEERLQEFLKLSEEKKASCGWTYSPVKGTLMNELKQLWGFNDKKRKYFDDYVLANSMNVEKSSWLDKYSATFSST